MSFEFTSYKIFLYPISRSHVIPNMDALISPALFVPSPNGDAKATNKLPIVLSPHHLHQFYLRLIVHYQ